MAKRILTRAKVKPVKKTKSEVRAFNRKRLGAEEKPVPLGPSDQSGLHKALCWYHVMCEREHAREFLSDWLSETGRVEELRKFKSVPDRWLNFTLCWMARLCSRGYTPSDSQRLRMEGWLKDVLKKSGESESDDSSEEISMPKRSKVDPMDSLMVDLERMIDSKGSIDLASILRERNIKSASRIVDKYSPQIAELEEALSKKAPPDLREAYRTDDPLWRSEVQNLLETLRGLVSTAQEHEGLKKAVKRATTRKPRAVPIEKKLKGFQHLATSMEYKVSSEDPAKIIGAQQAWIFDTKYKTITVLRAKDDTIGLDVKNSKILASDSARSATYKTGRQTEKIVGAVISTGKSSLHKVVEKLKTESRAQERVRDRCVILRVIR